jgi:phosphoglycolate phosphatase
VTLAGFRLIAFDLDGTLIDSRRDIADAANVLLERAGAGRLPEAEIGRMVGDGAAALVARAFAAAGRPAPPDALDQFLRIYDAALLVHTRTYPGVAAVLAALSSSHALAVLTNKPLGATRRILDGLDLARFFDPAAVLGGDGPLPRKPDPAGLRHLMARAGTGVGDTLLVGDSTIDWRTGQAAGVQVWLAGYGFGFGTVAAETAAAARVIGNPSDLIKL